MKNSVKLITFGLLCAGLTLAQRTAPDPGAMVQRQVGRLTQTLGLNTDQQGKATTLFTNAHAANESVMTGLREAHQSLATAIKNNDAGSIATLSTQIGTLTAQMTANNAKADAALYAILTPDQQAKYTPNAGMGGFGGGAFSGGRGPGGRNRTGGPQQ